MKGFQHMLAASSVAIGLAIGAPLASAEIQSESFKVVGTWHNLAPYANFEKPFWTEQLGKLSGGKLSAKINPITELGLKGFEVARLTKIGVFDVVYGVFGYLASEAAEIEGADLSAVSNDFKAGRELVDAYRPILDTVFKEKYGLKFMHAYPFPSQLIFCNKPINKLSDLKGKKVRVYATTLGDFVEGLGGTSVTISFAEVVPALQKGVVDCGITGTMPAFNAKWHEVITHAMKIRVGMGMAFMAMSLKKWDGLNADTQKFFNEQSVRLENEMWAASSAEDDEALRCLSGKGECTRGTPGTVVITDPSAEDLALRKKLLEEIVLKKWAERCSKKCVDDWNATAGKVAGVVAKK